MMMMSPEKFVKPADLFNMRRKSRMEQESPMKCLNNLTDPSPTKKLPTLLRNPFNPPVKRKLQLGGSGCSSSPNIKKRLHSSPRKSPIKKIRMFQMDEDANLEAPKMKLPVYQHPYLPWLTLYPRKRSELDKSSRSTVFKFTKHPQAIETMHNDWCESLEDLTNLLVDGKCPFFYLCSDHYTIHFRKNENKLQATIMPISFGMNSELRKANISVDTNDDSGIENDSSLDKDLGIEDDPGEDENSDASQFLESLGWSQQELVAEFQARKNNPKEDASSQSLSRSSSNKSSALIEGPDDIKKLVNFLKTNKIYTINPVGEFAHVPPTLLAPNKFHLGTLGRLIVNEPGFVD